MHQLIYRGCIAIVVVAVLTGASAQAAETAVPPAEAAADAKPMPMTTADSKATTAPFSVTPRQDERRLEQLRGGSEPVWNDMKLNGTVGANSAQNVVTGANTITDGAFANAVGLPTVIQNSGANVLIQNATIVNVQIR
ncbi:hypothetical protein [Duganella flavida]|uniref:hypothetical protein n=1 Tax=Duganella flavida TaxID=2692175 RepID=UPI001925C936|nr:hypothetical protein [Duganella flavida]